MTRQPQTMPEGDQRRAGTFQPRPRPRPRARTRYAAHSDAVGRNGVQTLAALLRQLRAEHGLTVTRLAERAVVDRRTVQRLERGQLRPRASTLARIAQALDPDRRAEIRAQLVDAAGDRIAEDSPAWLAYKDRRISEAIRAGIAPLAAAAERGIRLCAASDAMWSAAMELTDRAAAVIGRSGCRDLLELSDALRTESRLLEKDAGRLWLGTPARRHRGDPPDVSPYAPPLGDLQAVRRWLWEWQCREGRLRPRSARERAIAATGERERQRVRDAPPPQVVQAEDIAIRYDD